MNVPRYPLSYEYGLRLHQLSHSPSQWLYNASVSTLVDEQLDKDSTDVCLTCFEPISFMNRYQAQKIAVFEICEPCFVEGKFPMDFTSRDFKFLRGLLPKGKRRSSQKLGQGKKWSDQEVLKLLEEIQNCQHYSDDPVGQPSQKDWTRIAQEIGSKTPWECQQKFLELPIEESLVQGSSPSSHEQVKQEDEDAMDLEEDDEEEEGTLIWDTVVGQTDNPVMTLLNVFSSTLPPVLSSQSAKSVLKFIADQEDEEEIVFAGDDKKTKMGLDVEHMTRRGAELALQTGLNEARRLMEQEEGCIRDWTLILTELQMKRVELKMSILEDYLNLFS